MRTQLTSITLLSLMLASCNEKPIPVVEWKSIERSLQTEFISVADNDTIELPEGHFMFTKTLIMDGKSNIVIQGKGMDKTILSFKNQTEGAQGMQITNGSNITLQDFSVEDAKGDNIKVSDTRGITFRRVRSSWSGIPSNANGAYALYPVLCKHVLIEGCEAIGSSDAGIYVGQSDSVIIRNNKAYWNVAGIESENSRWVEIYGNEAYDNSGGLLVFDLPGLTQYGHTTKVYQNNLHDNNHDNFATPGNVVASIPPGTGMMILATHDLEMNDNQISNNKTVGTAIVSYEMVAALNANTQQQENAIGGAQTMNNNYKMDSLYDAFPYRIHIHNNTYQNSYWFPTLGHDIGKLFLLKSFLSPPDIAFDGIRPDHSDRGICIHDNGDIVFMDLDAAHDFKNLTKDLNAYNCAGVSISSASQ
jgi:parallel beta-helix repeat protein